MSLHEQKASRISDRGRVVGAFVREFVNLLLLPHVDATKDRFPKLLNHFFELFSQVKDSEGVRFELKTNDLFIQGEQIESDFFASEALHELVLVFSRLRIKRVQFSPDLHPIHLTRFIVTLSEAYRNSYSLDVAMHFEGILFEVIEWSEESHRAKRERLLSLPETALKNYFLFKDSSIRFFEGVASGILVPQLSIRKSVIELAEISEVRPDLILALSLIDEPESPSSSFETLTSQALSTSLLAMALARSLNLKFSQIVDMGFLGLLYNVGLFSKETKLLMKQEKLSSSEYRRILDAQFHGVHKFLKLNSVSRPVLNRLLALLEHAYGHRDMGLSLGLESRILKLCSQYIALIHSRPFRDAYLPSEAIKLLSNKIQLGIRGDLEPLLFYSLVKLLGNLPIGSLVQISDGRQAIVIRAHGRLWEKPVIRFRKLEGRDPEIVDMADYPHLKVDRILDPRKEGVNVAAYFFDDSEGKMVK